MPDDVDQKEIRITLIELRNRFSAFLQTKYTPKQFRNVRESVRSAYKIALEKRPNNCIPVISGTWHTASITLLTFIAVVFVIMYVITLFIVTIDRSNDVLRIEALETLTLVATLMGPWVLLRTYSDLYINFLDSNPTKFSSIMPFVAILIVVIFILFAVSNNIHISKVLVAGSAIAPVVLGVIFAIKPTVIESIGKFLAGQHWSWTLVMFFIPLMILLLLAMIELSRRTNRESS